MALDLDALSPEAREHYIAIGRRYGSELTLGQADDTLRALDGHAADVGPCGFGTRDTTRLSDGRDALLEAGVQRGGAKADVRAATAAFTSAMKLAKEARLRGDAILRGARSDLLDAGDTETVRAVDLTLDAITPVGSSAESLRDQLQRLKSTLALGPVADATADRGGPDATAAIDTALTTLRQADAARPGKPGTPEETQRLDLVDGIIVDLVRRARRAARAAARARGLPALAKAFELDALYQRPHHATTQTS